MGLVALGFVLLSHWLSYIEHNHDHAGSNGHETHEAHVIDQET